MEPISHTFRGHPKFIFLPLTSCVIQGKLLYLSVPLFLLSKKGLILLPHEVVVKHQEQYLTHSYCLINVHYFYVTALFCNIIVLYHSPLYHYSGGVYKISALMLPSFKEYWLQSALYFYIGYSWIHRCLILVINLSSFCPSKGVYNMMKIIVVNDICSVLALWRMLVLALHILHSFNPFRCPMICRHLLIQMWNLKQGEVVCLCLVSDRHDIWASNLGSYLFS